MNIRYCKCQEPHYFPYEVIIALKVRDILEEIHCALGFDFNNYMKFDNEGGAEEIFTFRNRECSLEEIAKICKLKAFI